MSRFAGKKLPTHPADRRRDAPRGGAAWAASIPGSTFGAAYRAKYAEYSDVAGSGQCAFLVLAAEVFGRFDLSSRTLVSSLARAHAQAERPILRRRLELIWHRRWWRILSVAVQVAVADSILPLDSRPADESVSSGRVRRVYPLRHSSLLELHHEGPEVSRLF